MTVTDDGVGFGAANSNAGVGLANIGRQLAARYGDCARVSLEERDGVRSRCRAVLEPAPIAKVSG